MSEMTSRQRWLAAIDGKPVDRLPFWPKLDAAYPRAQVAPFNTMTNRQIHDYIGSDKHEWLRAPVRAVRRDCALDVDQTKHERVSTFRTPLGELRRVEKWDIASQSFHPVEFPIKSAEDIAVMTAFYADEDWELDQDKLTEQKADIAALGETAVTACTIGQSPLMHWVEWDAGILNAHLLLADQEPAVSALFATLSASLLKKTRLVADQAVGDLYYYIENTSTSLISPWQYIKHCQGFITAVGEILGSRGKRFALHMCGTLYDLLPTLADVPAVAFEAYSSPPVGNTRYIDGKTTCPNKCLIGGTNATLWMQSPQEIVQEIEHDLSVLPDHRHKNVTSAGVMPPICPPDVIREVCSWVKTYSPRA